MKTGIMKQKSTDVRRMVAIANEGGSRMNSFNISTQSLVQEGMEVWLYRFKKSGVKKATFERLITSFNMAKKYSITRMVIADLTTADVQDFINSLVKDGYALNTIKKAYNLITGFVRFMIGEGASIAPCYINVVLPTHENTGEDGEEVVAYNKAEQTRLVAAAESLGTIGSKAAILMLETGIRSGEALALSWRDVDWGRKSLRIHKTLVYPYSLKRCFVQNSPKSKSSNRQIPLSTRAYGLLSDLYEQASPQSDDELIFHRESDKSSSMGYNRMAKHIQRLCSVANVEYRGLHVFRHTFATNCYYKGCEIKKLSKFLGHSSVTITYNTYIHLYGDTLEELRSIVD